MNEPRKQPNYEKGVEEDSLLNGAYQIPEEREYRIYVSSRGEVPVVKDICGDEQLALALSIVRATYPNDTVFVREILEMVREVKAPFIMER